MGAVHVNKKQQPSFQVRRWSLTHLQGPFEAFNKYDNWAMLLQNANKIKRYIDVATDYGIRSIELTGRPKEGGIDLDWLVRYGYFDRIARKGSYGDHIRRRQDLVRQINDWCTEENLQLWLWHHEPYFPDEFYQQYPEAVGQDYPICLSHPLVAEVIRGKIYESFDAMPDVTGLVLSMAECAGINIMSQAGCCCRRCRKLDATGRIRQIVDIVLDPLKKLGKGLVVRTFTHAHFREVLKHTETEQMLVAMQDLPEEVILMSKYCPQDFCGTEYPDDRLIGAFKNPHIVEFSLNREIMGGTWTPNLTPVDFKKRFENAKQKNCLGVVGRVDSPTSFDDPWLTIDHPNAFNLYCFGQLAQDVDTSIDQLWDSYLKQRYKHTDSKIFRKVLEPTEEIAQKTYMTLGTYAISYANRIPHCWNIESAFEFLSLAKWQPDWLETHNRIQSRDPSLLEDVLAEKDRAIDLAREAYEDCKLLKSQLKPLEYIQLELGMLRSEQAGRIWRYVSEIFFLARAIEAGTSDDVDRLFGATVEMLDMANRIRNEFGFNAWPVGLQPFRATYAEQFIIETWRPFIYKMLGEDVPRKLGPRYGDSQGIEELYPSGNIEHLWRILLRTTEPEVDAGGALIRLKIASPVRKIGIGNRVITIENEGGAKLKLPVYLHVPSFELSPGEYILDLSLPDRFGRSIDIEIRD
ncbi:MAG: hypothetical protein ABIG61_08565 [Planctomycetota bacterium]